MWYEICPFFFTKFINEPNFLSFFFFFTNVQPWITGAKDVFPVATLTVGCKMVNFMEFFNKIYIFCETLQTIISKTIFMGNGKISQSVTVARQKYPSQPWLMVANMLISQDFPIIFMQVSWLLKTCIDLWIWQKWANFISHSLILLHSQNLKFKYLWYGNIYVYGLDISINIPGITSAALQTA